MNKLNIILFFGLPGAGKSTLGNLIEEKLKIKYISVGDIYRNIENDINRSDEEAITFLLNSVEASLYIPPEYNQNYVIIDGIKLHNFLQKNFFKSLMNVYNISDVVFFSFVELNEFLKMDFNDDIYKEHFNLLKDRLTIRNRENENDSIIEKRLTINFYRLKKIISFITDIVHNFKNKSKNKKFKKDGFTNIDNTSINILTLNSLNSINTNYEIFEKYLNF